MFAERVKKIWLQPIVFTLLSLFLAPYSFAASADSIYNGTQVKLDILSPVLVPAVNKWEMQQYEMAVNVRLAKRYYPTLELGYAGGAATQSDTLFFKGQGGFLRVGADICPLKKHPESPHALLVGVRLGTAVQETNQYCPTLGGAYKGITADCWGEIVAGCQVEIAKVNNTSFYMGWMGRIKFLFTRQEKQKADPAAAMRLPAYIAGYGMRNNIGWGANYYLGWRF